MEKFENELKNWAKNVINAYYNRGESIVDTFQMVADIDSIIAKAFDRETVL